ncbi:hypothetical protein BST97_10810 [Nonlabens spongiae]|uniref:SbsA Ig-like domain-containing protein n=1 Tax=Nonlabens spongiae TaxID=331648 RepID=A0A1W6MLP8_9FLAO|nr:hypothetical protein BST97_10810 [Nonlabens spongiae]
MKNVKKNLAFLSSVALMMLLLVQCAKRGSPSGGPIDELPPIIVSVYPENYSTNFEAKEITIRFNEYIKFKDLRKQLVISPPMEYPPIILPQGGVGKEITIRIQDTLLENTTYVINFGQSVVDNNEGNPYPFLKYVFSTGDYVDSLKLKGQIKNVLEFETDEFVNVLLYELDSTYTDSAVFKEQPRYILNTLDSLTTFTMENLKEGTYQMVALKEENSDYRYDPSREKIGFYPEPITLPSDETYVINLYKQNLDAEIENAKHVSEFRIDVGYKGYLDSLKIEPVDKNLLYESRITKLDATDTLQYWLKPIPQVDTLRLNASLGNFQEEFKVTIKDSLKIDTLSINSKANDYQKKFFKNGSIISATTPIESVNENLFEVIDKDSTAVPFTLKIDSLRNFVQIDYKEEESQRYQMKVFPGAITDFYGSTNKDTLSLNQVTKANKEFGNIYIQTTNGEEFPVIVQIVTKDLKVVAQEVISTNKEIAFELMNPNTYYIRWIYDTNKNGRYDPGNILNREQPERIQYLRKEINLKPNWDVNEIISLE